jgi:hypothetical protein
MERKARTNPAQLHEAGKQEKSGCGRVLFLDIPIYRTSQDLAPFHSQMAWIYFRSIFLAGDQEV